MTIIDIVFKESFFYNILYIDYTPEQWNWELHKKWRRKEIGPENRTICSFIPNIPYSEPETLKSLPYD